MDVEWQGYPEPAESLPAGTFCFFQRRRATHLGIRVDDETRGPKLKGLVTFSTGYEAADRQPAFFNLSALGMTPIVYAVPSASIALPTDRHRIHLGSSGIDEPTPGIIMQLGSLLLLGVAFNDGMRFLSLDDGKILKDWPPSDHGVWFSAWSVIWRQRNEVRNLWDFKLELDAHTS